MESTLKEKTKAIIILSGGLDSSTLLYDIINQGYEVYALSFNYNQKHKIELLHASATCKKLYIPHKILDLRILNEIAPSALTRDDWKVPEGHYTDENMKQTVIPNRNMVMLSLATAYAIGINAKKIFYGAHKGDHCLPSYEVVITDKGKKYIKDLQINEKILSYNLETHKVSFQNVIKIVNNGLRSDIFEIVTINGNIICATSNHKFFKVLRRNFHQHTGWKKEIIEISVKDLKVGDWVIIPVIKKSLIKNCKKEKEIIDLLQYCDNKNNLLKYDEKNIWFKQTNKVNRYINIENFIKLIAWYITEGNGNNNISQNSSYRTTIAQSRLYNKEYYNEIKKLLKKWGFNNITETNESFWFSGPTTHVFKKCGRISGEKHIPVEFIQWLPKILFDTLMKGDGCITDIGYCYVTKSEKLKEQICWLAVLLGYSVYVTRNIKSNCYQINMNKRNDFKKMMNIIGDVKINQIKSIKKILPTYVYDITVENNHNFFAGKGNGILVSNSIYPDCRKEFIDKMKEAIKICDWKEVELEAPYWNIDKGDIVIKGKELGVDYSLTHTCYNPNGTKACGKCGACQERLEAFKKAGMEDPIEYEK
jgi:queuosine biosynthesis protein QueC